MNDLISRQAAIDALHMHLMYRMGTDSNKKRLDDWINGLPSVQPEQRWIPCSERMPEDRVNVLVCRTNGDEFIAHHFETGFVTILEPFLLEDDTVAAWMPLPEPYKDGEQDG